MKVITVVLFVEDLTGGLKEKMKKEDGMKKILSAKLVKMVLKILPGECLPEDPLDPATGAV